MKLVCIILILGCSSLLQAQTTGDESARFGFQAGAGFSNMNFNKGEPTPAVKIDPSWKAGIQLGFILRIPLGSKWLLQPEYNYVQRNGADKSIATSYELDYLSLPLLLHYNICRALSVYAGPQAELLVRATSSAGGIKTTITHDTEERSIAATAGAEWRFAKPFFFAARYLHGFNHIGIGQRSNVKEFKYEGLSLTAGIHF